MNCPRCNSDKIQIQAKKGKNPVLLGCLGVCGGLGLMFLGIVGLILGLIVGLVIGAVAKAIMSTPIETIAVCQNCGSTFNPTTQPMNIVSTPITQFTAQSTDIQRTISITRLSNSCGSAMGLKIIIDNSNPIILNNGNIITMKVSPGEHTLFYEQQSGIGKKKRTGSYTMSVDTDLDKNINIVFVANGLKITEV